MATTWTMEITTNTTEGPRDFDSTWDLGRIGYFIWGSICLLAATCMVILRSKPSNGICLLYLQYVLAHVTLSVLIIVSGILQEGTLTSRIINWLTHMGLVFAASVYFRIGNFLLVKLRRPVYLILTIIAWVSMLVLWIVVTVLHFVPGLVAYSAIVYGSYYTMCALFAVATMYRESYIAFSIQSSSYSYDRPRIYCMGSNRYVRSICVGRSHRAVTFLAVIAGTVGMIDWIMLIISSFGVQIWEVSFLSRLLDSVLYVPLIVPFFLWYDCPSNVRVHTQSDNHEQADIDM